MGGRYAGAELDGGAIAVLLVLLLVCPASSLTRRPADGPTAPDDEPGNEVLHAAAAAAAGHAAAPPPQGPRGRVVEVADDVALLAAVRDPAVSVVVVTRDIRLGPAWDFNMPVPMQRDLTLRGRQHYPQLDMAYKERKLTLFNTTLRIEGLEIFRSARIRPSNWLTLLSDSSTGHLVLDHVVKHSTACFDLEVMVRISSALPRPDGQANILSASHTRWCKTDGVPPLKPANTSAGVALAPGRAALLRQGEPPNCWGMWLLAHDGLHHFETTPFYVSPEVCTTGKLTKASDSYSFGIVAWETLTGLHPYKAAREGSVLVINEAFLRSFGEWPGGPMQTLIRSCLAENPRARPTMATIQATLQRMCEDPWLAVGWPSPSKAHC